MHECPQCGYDLTSGEPEELTFIYATRFVWFRRKCVKLTERQMEILEHLYDAGDRGCTNKFLVDEILSGEGDRAIPISYDNLQTHISNLRRALTTIGLTIKSTGRAGGGTCRYSIAEIKNDMVLRTNALERRA